MHFAGIFFVSGCGQATPVHPTDTPIPPTVTPVPAASITRDDLLGRWWIAEIAFYIQFSEDGAYRLAETKYDFDNDPRVVGRYGLDGNHLVLVNSLGGCEGLPGEYEVELTDIGLYLHILPIEDQCEGRNLEDTSPWLKLIE